MKVCIACGAASDKERLPSGWKDRGGLVRCAACWRKLYCLRAVSLPVASTGQEWKDFAPVVVRLWRQSTALANWAAQELLRRDVRRVPSMERLPPMAPVDLYNLGLTERGGATPAYPDFADWRGMKQGANCVLRGARADYIKSRLAVLWHGSERPLLYRFPFPFPIDADAWRISFGERDGAPTFTTNLCGKRRELRLRCGSEFCRQIAALRQIATGEGFPGEAALYGVPCSSGRHRGNLRLRTPGGRAGDEIVLMVKIAAWLPRREATGGRTLLVRTDPNALWVAELDGRQAWVLNEDHVRRLLAWQNEWACRRQRLSQDCKAERRLRRPRHLAWIGEDIERRAQKNRDRLRSWCQESAAALAGYARRQGVGVVIYDDTNRQYLPSLPWHNLRTALASRLEADGIELVVGADPAASAGEGEGAA